ncbi:MAG: antitoxin [Micromonosporaceae bacterium]
MLRTVNRNGSGGFRWWKLGGKKGSTMGLMDKFDDMKKKGKDLAEEHSDKVDKGMEKGKDFANEKTKGKYSEQIDKGSEKAREQLDK